MAAASTKMEQVPDKEDTDRAKAMEEAIILMEGSDIEIVSALEIARLKVAKGEQMRKRQEMKLKTRQLAHLCGNLPRLDLEKLLPEEMWEAVLDRLDTKESIKVSRNSEFLDAQVKKWKTLDLFAEVFPHVHKYLYLEDVFNMRQVCTKWKLGIDDYLIVFGCHHPKPDMQPPLNVLMERGSFSQEDILPLIGAPEQAPLCQVDLWAFKKAADFNDNFVEDRDSEGKYPFISRSLMVGIPFAFFPVDYFPLWEEVLQTLNIHGRKLHHLCLNLFFGVGVNQDYLRLWNLICDYLHLTTNLRSLDIFYGPQGNLTDRNWNLMEHLLNPEALPELPHLIRLRVFNAPHVTTNRILRRYPNIQKLEMKYLSTDPFDPMEGIVLPNLKHWIIRNGEVAFNFPIQVSQFPALDTISAPFTLFETSATNSAVSSWLQSVGQLGPTLHHLTLGFHAKWMSQGNVKTPVGIGNSAWMNLPNLQTLNIFLDRVNLKSMDFLLPLISLKELTVRFFKEYSEQDVQQQSEPWEKKDPFGFVRTKDSRNSGFSRSDNEEIIRFMDCTTHMYDSNIWKLFPYLQKINIKTTSIRSYSSCTCMPVTFPEWEWKGSESLVYTRDKYEQLTKETNLTNYH